MWLSRLLFFLLLSNVLFAESLHWQGNYNKALLQAKDENKTLLVLVVKNREPLCGEIIKNVFMNQPYIKALNEKSVAVIVTYEGVLSYPIELYYTAHFPTLFFVDAKTETFLKEPLYENNITVASLTPNRAKENQ